MSATDQAALAGSRGDAEVGPGRHRSDPEGTEADLVRRACAGDLDAYAALLRPHEQAARRVAWLISGDDGDDATQEAFVKGWHALHRYRREGSFRGWLLQIVANEARNRRRAAGRRRHHEWTLADDRSSGEGVVSPSPELAVLGQEQRGTLLRAVEALPDRLREVVVSRHLIGLSEAETALALAIPVGTVKSRLARGLDRLRAEWDEDEEEAERG